MLSHSDTAEYREGSSGPRRSSAAVTRTLGLTSSSTPKMRQDPKAARTTVAAAAAALPEGTRMGQHSPDVLYTNPEITALASSAATVMAKSLLHPLDTLKCRMQILRTDVPPHSRHNWRACSPFPSASPSSRTVWARVRQLRYQYEGQWTLRHLYGGLIVKLAFYVPYQATYMSSYNFAQTKLQSGVSGDEARPLGRPSGYIWLTVVAAVFAEVMSAALRVPMETLKMRVQSTVTPNSLAAARQLWHQGFRACCRLALPQTLMHDIPYSIVQWLVYETLRPWTQQWGSHLERRQVGEGSAAPDSMGSLFQFPFSAELARTFVSGGFSGLLASAVTVPLDNIRTRVIVSTAFNPKLNIRGLLRDVYRHEGLRGFVRGGGLRVLWVTTNMALYFPFFEGMRILLQRRAVAAGDLVAMPSTR